MAAHIERNLGHKVEIIPGHRGEFTVWVDSRQVASKTIDGFPTEDECLEAVVDVLSLAPDARSPLPTDER